MLEHKIREQKSRTQDKASYDKIQVYKINDIIIVLVLPLPVLMKSQAREDLKEVHMKIKALSYVHC